MRPEPFLHLERYRFTDIYSSEPGASWGMFRMRLDSAMLRIISSGQCSERQYGDWEHVSVSVEGQKRCPTWDEMKHVKELFWRDDETVVQFHPAKADYVSVHPYVLHMWRHRDGHALPPKETIA